MNDRKVYVGRRRPMTAEDWRALGWDDEQAARLLATAQTEASVLVITPDGVTPLRHVPRHSPTGMEWGYGGSGPSDLALSILTDHYGQWRTVERDGTDALRLPVSYQDFKFDVIARLPTDRPWSLTAAEIDEWAASRAAAA